MYRPDLIRDPISRRATDIEGVDFIFIVEVGEGRSFLRRDQIYLTFSSTYLVVCPFSSCRVGWVGSREGTDDRGGMMRIGIHRYFGRHGRFYNRIHRKTLGSFA